MGRLDGMRIVSAGFLAREITDPRPWLPEIGSLEKGRGFVQVDELRLAPAP